MGRCRKNWGLDLGVFGEWSRTAPIIPVKDNEELEDVDCSKSRNKCE